MLGTRICTPAEAIDLLSQYPKVTGAEGWGDRSTGHGGNRGLTSRCS
jgi:hypothetical protein